MEEGNAENSIETTGEDKTYDSGDGSSDVSSNWCDYESGEGGDDENVMRKQKRKEEKGEKIYYATANRRIGCLCPWGRMP